MHFSHDVTLIWGEKNVQPSGDLWAANGAERWASLGEAIRFATALQADRASMGLHPWIWTPSGHVYSPETIAVMSQTADANRLRARANAPIVGLKEGAQSVAQVRISLGT